MSTGEVIQKYYEYANAGNWDAWCDLFAEDMVMDEQLAGHIEGLANLRPMMRGMKTTYSKFQNEPKQVIVKGNEAAVVSHISAASAAGAPIEADVMNYFRLKRNKIVYMANFHDSRPFAPILTPENPGRSAPNPSKAQGRPGDPVIHRFAGRFMELPRDHVNAYIVELENSVVVIDTTLALSSAQALRAKAESFGKPLRAVLLTHGHPDHYTGLAAFEDLPRIGSQGCLDFAHEEDIVKASTAAGYLGEDYPKTRLFPNQIVEDGYMCTFDGVTFTFHDLGPAESPSDGMWVIEEDGVKHVFVGDVVALDCHCFFRDGHTLEWNQVLENLKRQFDDAARFYIGHGESPVGKEAIDWQLGYNRTFLNAVANLEDKSIPVSRPIQEKVIAAMKKYLPSDATLFLLDYELGQTIVEHFPNRGFGAGQGKQFYKEQLALMAAGKIDELIARHYHRDAVMVTFDGIRRGHDELKKYYVDTLKIMGQITYLATEYFAETEDAIIFKAVITSQGRGTVHADNGLYLKDGKIYRHIALTLLPDIDYDRLGTRWKE